MSAAWTGMLASADNPSARPYSVRGTNRQRMIDIPILARVRHSPMCRRTACPGAHLWKNEKPADIAGLRQSFAFSKRSGAGEGARTLDPDLGKVVLYH